MSDLFKMFLIALLTSVASQVFLTPYILRLQGISFPTTVASSQIHSPTPTQPLPPIDPGGKWVAPNLEGMSAEEARERWRDRGVVVIEEGERTVAGAEPGTIVQQRPSAGTELTDEKKIHVIVAKAAEQTAVPGVVGLPAEEARETLVRAGFEVAEPRLEASAEAPAGSVIRQIPGANGSARAGSVVRLVVAQEASVEVPAVKGIYLAEARRTLTEAGLTLGKVRRVEDPERGENYVLRQEPAPGAKVPPGTEVQLVVVAPD